MPRAQTRTTDTETRTDKVTAATSSTSLYDNVGATTQTGTTQGTNNPKKEYMQNNYDKMFKRKVISCQLKDLQWKL